MKIWLIDDDNVTNMLNRYFLEEHYPNLEIKTFIYASDALNLLLSDEEIPNFILLDINMPGMNGWEFLEAYQQSGVNSENIPSIYMLSSSLDPEDEAKARKSDFVKGFISKPLEVEKLPFLNA
jgi:CheY-like chemotaxis protein